MPSPKRAANEGQAEAEALAAPLGAAEEQGQTEEVAEAATETAADETTAETEAPEVEAAKTAAETTAETEAPEAGPDDEDPAADADAEDELPELQSPGARTTYQGLPATAWQCRVIVEREPHPSKWYAEKAGQPLEAVKLSVELPGRLEPAYDIVYVDNEDGSGWAKFGENNGNTYLDHRELLIAGEAL